MREERNYLALPIHSLQEMLRQISFRFPTLPRLIPDGIFGENTLEAVMRFQKEYGKPITGEVDNDTWDAIVTVYRQVLSVTAPPRPLNAFPGPGFHVDTGQYCVHMLVVQAMFQALVPVTEGVEAAPITGSHTGPSVRNVIWLQRRAGLADNGVMDVQTWNALSRAYALFITRGIGARCSEEPPTTSGPSTPTVGFPWEPAVCRPKQ